MTALREGKQGFDRLAPLPDRWTPFGDAGVAARFGAAVALAVSAEHWGAFPSHLHKQPWLGWLFVLGAAALLYTTLMLAVRPSFTAWLVGAGTTGAMIIGGILSRTTGLPGVYFKHWGPPLLVSLSLEALFLVLWVATRFGTTATVRPRR